MVRLLPCDLEGTSSNPGNSPSTLGGKAAYIYLPMTPPSVSLVRWFALFLEYIRVISSEFGFVIVI